MTNKRRFIISVYSPTGGQGTSFVAVQLAHQFAKLGPTCLLDLNLDLSVSLLYLNQDAQEAFRKSAFSTVESTKLSNFAIKVENNYYAVGVPLIGYGHFAEETDESVKEFFEQCRAEFDFTIVDLPHPHQIELTRNALAKSDLVICLIGNSEHSVEAAVAFNQLLKNPKLKAVQGKEVYVINNRNFVENKKPQAAMQVAVVFAMLVVAIMSAPFQALLASNPTNTILITVLSCLVLLIMPVLNLIPSKRTGTKLLKSTKQNEFQTFHELPNDAKSSLFSINQGKFLTDNNPLGAAIHQLSQKILKRLESSN